MLSDADAGRLLWQCHVEMKITVKELHARRPQTFNTEGLPHRHRVYTYVGDDHFVNHFVGRPATVNTTAEPSSPREWQCLESANETSEPPFHASYGKAKAANVSAVFMPDKAVEVKWNLVEWPNGIDHHRATTNLIQHLVDGYKRLPEYVQSMVNDYRDEKKHDTRPYHQLPVLDPDEAEGSDHESRETRPRYPIWHYISPDFDLEPVTESTGMSATKENSRKVRQTADSNELSRSGS
ncbi:hypothetical protein LTR27_003947 [Elasticomyces elasticus]|nr:hypothetical protein LTR27_003947 [Elasticomyces elasticus]